MPFSSRRFFEVPLTLALLALSAGPAFCAESAASALKEGPMSVAWGPNPQARLEAVFHKVLDASGYDAPALLRAQARTPTKLVYSAGRAVIDGMPLLSRAAGTPDNEGDGGVIEAGYGIFDICHSDDELASVIGHELSHLILNHQEKMEDKQQDLYDEWREEKADGLYAGEEDEENGFQEMKGDELAAYARSQEREADANGLRLARAAGYNPAAAAAALEHAEQWARAMGGRLDSNHDPLKTRIAALRKQAEAMAPKREQVESAGQALLLRFQDPN